MILGASRGYDNQGSGVPFHGRFDDSGSGRTIVGGRSSDVSEGNPYFVCTSVSRGFLYCTDVVCDFFH